MAEAESVETASGESHGGPGVRTGWRRGVRWIAKAFVAILGLLLLMVLVGGLWLRSQLTASLPKLEGEQVLPSLEAPLNVARDALGIPTLSGSSRLDVARGLGFVHAQDRFFQMDLQRRRAAGELSELFGTLALRADRPTRIHRFRHRARLMLEASSVEIRDVLEAYAEGVNAGLDALGSKPFEYIILRAEPTSWQPEDSFLTLLAMFLQLQDNNGFRESGRGLMAECLPAEVFDFLLPDSTSWASPIDGESVAELLVPSSDAVDLRDASAPPVAGSTPPPPPTSGSNSWAIAAAHAADHGALLSNDMHLGLSVPNIWYRASFVWPSTVDSSAQEQVTGATLPGLPAMVIGSNTHVAWGFTNSAIDTSDVVELELQDDETYLTPDGPRRFERHREVIRVKGGEDEVVDVVETIWGPLLDPDSQGERHAYRWVAYDVEAVNLELIAMETARSVDDGVAIAQRSGVPALNLLVADTDGRIAWTIAGRVPAREGQGGEVPMSWRDGSYRWSGMLSAAEYPRIVDPESGRLWTANNRVVSGEMLEKLGDGGYALGARARQIRDQLFALEQATAEDMLRIQLDNRALFLEPWRELLLDLLTTEKIANDPRRQEARKLVEGWGGRAAVDSVGYYLVRQFRLKLSEEVFAALTATCLEIDPEFDFRYLTERFEAPLWHLASERPPHLLSSRYSSWDDQLLAAVDAALDNLEEAGRPLVEAAWGERNRARIRHPLSGALPLVGRWLDMPADPLPGDSYMPRVQGPSFGASQRMVVSPGREADGYFHMPGGQSGHPMSPHYRDAHAAWVEGQPTPFLAGPVVHQLELVPGADR